MAKIIFRKFLIGDFTLKRLVRSIVFLYCLFFVIAMFFSNFLIFRPPSPTYDTSDKRIVTFFGTDSNIISAIYLPAKSNNFTIFFCHGNGEDIGNRIPIFEMLNDLGFGVFCFDYRGYGLSTGKPSEKNVLKDSETAFSYLTKNLSVPSNEIILHGQSLGGGVVVPLAVNHKVGGLVLESSFVTVFRVLTRISIFPFDEFKNIEKINKVKCPVLIIHGLKDKLIAPWHGKKLFEAANEPKISYWVKEAGHNDLIHVAGSEYFLKILEITTRIAIGEFQIKKDNIEIEK